MKIPFKPRLCVRVVFTYRPSCEIERLWRSDHIYKVRSFVRRGAYAPLPLPQANT